MHSWSFVSRNIFAYSRTLQPSGRRSVAVTRTYKGESNLASSPSSPQNARGPKNSGTAGQRTGAVECRPEGCEVGVAAIWGYPNLRSDMDVKPLTRRLFIAPWEWGRCRVLRNEVYASFDDVKAEFRTSRISKARRTEFEEVLTRVAW